MTNTKRKHLLMYKLFGLTEGKDCNTCEHLIKTRLTDRTYYKCECYGMSGSEATDWKKHIPACGLYNREYTGNPVVKMVKPEKQEEAIPGQMTLKDFI